MPVQSAAVATASTTNDRVQGVYRRLAKIYDVAFGVILQSGREHAIRAMSTEGDLRVLEIGIGTALTLSAYPSNYTIVGLDFSAAMLDRAKRRVSTLGVTDRVTLLQADAAQLPFGDGFFDVVFAPYVMSVVSDPRQVGRELHRVCRQAGRVMMLNHFRSELPALAKIERLVTPVTRHLGFRTDLPLAPLLADTGLRALSVQKVNVPPLWQLVICVKSDRSSRTGS